MRNILKMRRRGEGRKWKGRVSQYPLFVSFAEKRRQENRKQWGGYFRYFNHLSFCERLVGYCIGLSGTARIVHGRPSSVVIGRGGLILV